MTHRARDPEVDTPALAHDRASPRPRLSIAVLPFTNLSNDPDQQYFADGITEDVTTDLSRIRGVLVISRNTAFTYWNRTIETKQIGRELGVGYVLEGSVRRAGSHIRVSAQLIDAETDGHLWAEQFDCGVSDLFALQNEITSRIAVTFSLELVRTEAARSTQNPDALDYFLRYLSRHSPRKPPVLASRAKVQVGWALPFCYSLHGISVYACEVAQPMAVILQMSCSEAL